MASLNDNGWKHADSEFNQSSKIVDGKARAVFFGRYHCNGIEMKFHAVEQASGRYTCRGIISAISPLDDKVLQMAGNERARQINALVDNGKIQSREDAEKHRVKALNVSRSLYCSGNVTEASVKNAVEIAAQKLYIRHAPLLQKTLQQSNRPDSITPAVAYAAYAGTFFDTYYKNIKQRSAANYKSQMGALLRMLPNVPMHSVKSSTINEITKKLCCSKSEIHRARTFWQYMLDHGYCTGSNPIPDNTKRQESAMARQEKGKRPVCLDLEQQDKLFSELYSGTVSGSDCGIALYAWGGFALKDEITWGRVHLSADDPTLATIDYNLPDLAGATHDYTRPVFPFCALILAKRFGMLREKFSEEELRTAPVVSMRSNLLKPVSNESFLADVSRVFQRIGLDALYGKKRGNRTAAAKRILADTYINDVYTRSGLEEDEGTCAFLCGRRILDVTSANYTKFNDPDGIARMHAAERLLAPPLPNSDTEKTEALPGETKYTFSPKSTRRSVGVGCDIILPPGGTITVRCAHGAEAVLSCREMKTDGKARRKTSGTQSKIRDNAEENNTPSLPELTSDEQEAQNQHILPELTNDEKGTETDMENPEQLSLFKKKMRKNKNKCKRRLNLQIARAMLKPEFRERALAIQVKKRQRTEAATSARLRR